MAAAKGFRTIKITFKGSPISVYASKKTADALTEIEKQVAVFHGVKLHQVLEAVYLQGKKDGAAETFTALDKGLADAKKVIPHKRPGRPRKRAA